MPEQIVVCAHRGASGTFPENTLPAFAAAVSLGCQMIEFDVRATADGYEIVQGLELDAGRYTLGGAEQAEMQFDFGEIRIDIEEIVWVVLTPATTDGSELVLWLGRDDEGEPVSVEDIEAFLEPFQVGPDR